MTFLPLFGLPEVSGRRDVPATTRLLSISGTLNLVHVLRPLRWSWQESVSQVSQNLLKVFRPHGVVASLAIHQERLVSTVTKLQRSVSGSNRS